MKIDPETLPLPAEPYRGILPFRLLDWRIFLERDAETERLANFVSMYRGVLLYGQSGAGKSSLLNAGLIPHALGRGRAPERIRVFPASGRELLIERIHLQEEGVNHAEGGDLPHYLPSRFTAEDNDDRVPLSCDAFLQTLRTPSELGVPLLIFDQFEELVTLFDESAKNKERFAEANTARIAIEKLLCELLLSDSLPVKIIFAFRDDYLARLTPLFSRIPNLMDQGVRLDPPRVERLQRIVRGPFVKSEDGARGLPGHFKNEASGQPDELSEELAVKIADGIRERRPSGIANLSEVQTLCFALWRQPQRREELLCAQDPAAVLQQIIESEAVAALSRLLPWDRVRAVALLANLVTQDGTRDVVSEENLIEETRRNPVMWIYRGDLRKLLNAMPEKTGLLRRSLSAGNTYYELASEFLIPWIQKRQQQFRKLALVIWAYVFAGLVLLLFLAGYFAYRADDQKHEVQKAVAVATENLWHSYLEAARASGRMHDSGRRFQALEAIEKAAKIRATPELRDVAASALMLADLQRRRHRPRDREEWLIDHSGDFKSYAHLDLAGHATLRRTADDAVLGSLDFSTGANAWPWLSRDARLLAVLDGHGVMRIRRWSDGTTVLEIPGAHDAAWHPGGERIAISCENSIDEYSVTSKARTGSWACPRAQKIAYSPDGSRLAAIVAGRTEIQIIDTASGAVLQRLPGDDCDSLAWHPTQAILATSGEIQIVAIFNTDTGERMKQWMSEGGHVTALVFSRDGGSLITAGWDTHVRLWNWRTAELQVTALSGGTDELRLSLDGRQIASRDAGSCESSIYDLTVPEAAQTLAQVPRGSRPAAVFDPRGRWLAVCEGTEVNLWTSDGRRHLASLPSDHANEVAFHPNKSELCVASAGGLAIFPLLAKPDGTCDFGQPRTPIDKANYEHISFSRDGSLAAVVAHSECLIYETETWTLRARTGIFPGEWRGPDFSPDGRWVADRIWQGSWMHVWDTRRGEDVFHRQDYDGPGPRFTPDGTTLLAALPSLHAYATDTWRATEPPLPKALADTNPRTLVFSPDGTLVASGLIDRVRIARWPSCEPLLELNVMPDPRITGLAFSPDNHRLLVVGALGRVELVDLAVLREQLTRLGLGW